MNPTTPETPTDTEDPKPLRASLPLIVAASVTWAISLMGYYAQTQILESLMTEHGIGEAAAGRLFSAENTAFFVTLIAIAGPLARLSRSRVAFVGAGFVVAGNLACVWLGNVETLMLARIVTGMGAGLISAAGTASVASSREPDRIFAAVTVGSGLLLALEPIALPHATVPFGSHGAYLLMAVSALVLMPTLRWLLPPRAVAGTKGSLLDAPNRRFALFAMAALVIFEVGQTGVYTFVASIGERSGLDTFEVGTTLGVTSFTGFIGGLVAAYLGTRWGRRLPIIIGLSLNAVSAAGLALCGDATLFIVLNTTWNLAYYFVVPYMMGAMASLDDLGRWAVASDGAWNGGTALAPAIAGALVESSGYVPLAGMALLCGLVCTLLLTGVLRSQDS